MIILKAQSATAQSSNAQADALFTQGRELMSSGKIDEACSAFEASQRLDPAVSTLLNLADCREKNGQLATSWAYFLEAERLALKATDDSIRGLQRVAAERAAKIEPRLPKLTIRVTGVHTNGLEVLHNNAVVEPSTWNRSLPVDGGSHEIVVRAPNHKLWTVRVIVGREHDDKVIEVPPLQLVRVSPAPTRSPGTSHESRRRNSRLLRLTAYGALSTGGGLVLGSAVAGGLAWFKWRDAKAVCGKTLECDNDADLSRAYSLAHDARVRGRFADILAITGAVSMATGAATVWLTRNRRVVVAPEIRQAMLGLNVDVRY